MTRTCPSCGHRGPSRAFPLLPPADTPPRHAGRRRKCPACGHEARAWTFSGQWRVYDPHLPIVRAAAQQETA